MSDEETYLIGCPVCGDIYRWRPAPDTPEGGKGWECLGKLTKEELMAKALQGRTPSMGWPCMDCQNKRSAGKTQ